MRNRSLVAVTGLLIALATPAFAEHGGDRQPAGGAFMSSYSRGPYAPDPRFAAPQSGFAADGWARPNEPAATGSTGRDDRPRRRAR